ncbi:MAG: ribosome maturation factor RimP [Candidatus Binatia bacterium]
MDTSVIGRVWRAVDPLVTAQGMEIVDIDYRREGRGNVLRFYLDRPDRGVTIDELTAMSRRLGDFIEVHDLVPASYTLEVSSPGINRRLRQPDHFRRYVGKRVRVRTIEHSDGRRAFIGVLRDVRADGIVCVVGSDERFVPFHCIAQANYEHEFPEPPRRRASGR